MHVHSRLGWDQLNAKSSWQDRLGLIIFRIKLVMDLAQTLW